MNAPTLPNLLPKSIDMQIGGMTCASCVMRVENTLRKVPGITVATVNLAGEQAQVQADASVTANALAAAVRQAGCEVASVDITPTAMSASEVSAALGSLRREIGCRCDAMYA